MKPSESAFFGIRYQNPHYDEDSNHNEETFVVIC